jgi:hypothetical protein
MAGAAGGDRGDRCGKAFLHVDQQELCVVAVQVKVHALGTDIRGRG